jgi:transcriptional regulator with XRE-family HTH domain
MHVSRQAVGKWESGRAVPELTKLIEICDFFGVSLDSLARPGECAARCVGPSAPDQGAIISFLIRAKRVTYAGHGAEAAPSRTASHDLAYHEGDLSYYDTYLGGEKFAGEEAVWVEGKPVWAMNYVGRVISEGFSGDFLKEALAAVPEDMPYRGPRLFQRGELSYHCAFDGDFGWFQGFEEIFSEGRKVFECRFHGGFVV